MAEEINRAAPAAKVVKAFNTVGVVNVDNLSGDQPQADSLAATTYQPRLK